MATNPVMPKTREDAVALLRHMVEKEAPLDSLVLGLEIVARAGFPAEAVYEEAIQGHAAPKYQDLILHSQL